MSPPPTNGIHSLPSETLSDIFRFAVAAVTPKFWQLTPLLQAELERVANAPLLILSRVCSRWHDIAINNPTFWSDVEINGVSGRTPSALEKTIRLLNARLERSRDAPLSLLLRCGGDSQPLHTRIFYLLAQHSHRWETVYAVGSLEGVDTSVLRGRLPRLRKLALNVSPETVDFFGIAPRLDNLCIPAPLLHSESFGAILRRKQLRSFGCVVMFRREFEEAISLLPELPVATDFYLTIDLDRRIFQSHWTMPLHLPSITAPISTLACRTVEEFHPHHLSSALSQIFASLTLPKLRQVLLGCSVYPQLVLEWPHTQFLALCERSDLGRCLKTLRIAEVRMAERDLLEILSVLEALEHLEVGDAPGNVGESNDSELVLITDSFLRAMTWAPAQDSLVPRLSYFACVSRLVFTHGLVVDFVTSRFARLSDSPILFHFCIHPLPESDACLNSAVHTKLWELAAGNKQFVYQSGEEYIKIQ
ncbi:hypothetical protein B0H14DRAFT_2765229 [Mycena olivaceomarginata]|nr:hypothetical protein B0H14DRAFT_2765229 [Mycena olivaceomarginata]